MFDTQMVFQEECFEKVDFLKKKQMIKKHEQFLREQTINPLLHGLFLDDDIIFYY